MIERWSPRTHFHDIHLACYQAARCVDRQMQLPQSIYSIFKKMHTEEEIRIQREHVASRMHSYDAISQIIYASRE